jgi:hypothetical protein
MLPFGKLVNNFFRFRINRLQISVEIIFSQREKPPESATGLTV